MAEKTLLTPEQAKKLTAKLNAIEKRIGEIKNSLIANPTFGEKLKLKHELKELKRLRKPIARELKYTLHVIKKTKKMNENAKLVDEYYKGK